MAQSVIPGASLAGLVTSVPTNAVNNVRDTSAFSKDEVRKVVAMAGVTERRVVEPGTCSTDLCTAAAETLLAGTGWSTESIDALIFVTQTPDYIMPSSSCVVHKRLGLHTKCAAFDLGLGCSGYPYGLWLASMMLHSGGLKRVLLLHGETPTLYASASDRSVSLLFGDAGSATAIEADDSGAEPWSFVLHTDGGGYPDLIVEAGGFRDRFAEDRQKHYVRMNGASVFNFTIRAVPPLIRDALTVAGRSPDEIDYYIFHQSNRFIIQHLISKCSLAAERVPMVLDRFGNSGGPSVPLAVTQGIDPRERARSLRLMLLGYGVGLSWGSAVVTLRPETFVAHVEVPGPGAVAS